jgi:hypothetical protein
MQQDTTIEVSAYPTHAELGRALETVAQIMRRNYPNLYPGMTHWEIKVYSLTARCLELIAKRFINGKVG